MGVSGLVPFLRKKSPHVLKSVPSRFKDLQGKVVVFDGTLITQRFHFAPTAHEYRHVLGWYRLIQELHENNVRAVCVFDGKKRHAAKQREVMRRHEQRKMAHARGAMEMERLSRLTQLTPLTMSYESLSERQKADVATSLQSITEDLPVDPYPTDKVTFELETDRPDTLQDHSPRDINTSSPANIPPWPVNRDDSDSSPQDIDTSSSVNISPLPANRDDSDSSPQDINASSSIDTSPRPVNRDDSDSSPQDIDASSSVNISPLPTNRDDSDSSPRDINASSSVDTFPRPVNRDDSDGSPQDTNTSSSANISPRPANRDDSDSSPLDEVTSDLKPLTIGTDSAGSESPPTHPITAQVEGPATHGPSRVSSTLAALYSSFLTSVRQMGTLLSSRTVLPGPGEQDDETKVTQELSQAQRRLLVEEERIWKRLSETTSKEGTEEDVSFLARELEDKSAKILTSYERRNSPPTSEVYDQSRTILQAMGVPCIGTKGGVEGEALAAAIVRDGLADYVASEDTDVLVYGAPLLRNVTSGTEPLTLIEGHEVRNALDMDSSQFLDFALLLGTDFTDRIRNVGPIRALKFILSYGSIEKIIEGEPKYTPKSTIPDYLEQIRVAREVFRLNPTVPAPELLEVRQPNDSLVLEVLQRFQLQRYAEKDADLSSLLGENYFSDQP